MKAGFASPAPENSPMKTRCPGCQTTFRVSPEQIKARAGKVRCGQCEAVFNALDSLVEDSSATPATLTTVALLETEAISAKIHVIPAKALSPTISHPLDDSPVISQIEAADTPDEAPAVEEQPAATPLSDAASQALAKASGLIAPRETTEIPGYSKWAEGMMSSPTLPLVKPAPRWPFTLVTLLLALALLGQIIFHFRSELNVAAPALRPLLVLLSDSVGADIPLPRHSDLVSIETSDLQADPARANQLALQATLRNRAGYAQAFPALELALTDTQDNAIARRVFSPAEYLPQNMASQPFAANGDTAIRLWIEIRDISPAGYRLYVFYP